MSNEVNGLKVLLEELKGVINLGEEKLKNKLTKVEFLEIMQERDEKIYKTTNKLNDRINGLYLKIAGCSGIIVVGVEAFVYIIRKS